MRKKKMQPVLITDAQRIADRIGADAVVLIAFGDGGMLAGASYGADKRKCHAIGRWMDVLFYAMEKGAWPAPQFED